MLISTSKMKRCVTSPSWLVCALIHSASCNAETSASRRAGLFHRTCMGQSCRAKAAERDGICARSACAMHADAETRRRTRADAHAQTCVVSLRTGARSARCAYIAGRRGGAHGRTFRMLRVRRRQAGGDGRTSLHRAQAASDVLHLPAGYTHMDVRACTHPCTHSHTRGTRKYEYPAKVSNTGARLHVCIFTRAGRRGNVQRERQCTLLPGGRPGSHSSTTASDNIYVMWLH